MLGWIRTHWAIVLGVFGTAVVITLVVWYPQWLCDFLQSEGVSCPPRREVLNLGALIVLAIITAVYAYHTFQLGKEAAKQAEASQQQAKATAETAKAATLGTRLSFRPVLAIRPEQYHLDVSRYGAARSSRVSEGEAQLNRGQAGLLEVWNLGSGLALNPLVLFGTISKQLPALGPGEYCNLVIDPEDWKGVKESLVSSLRINYLDIFNDSHTSTTDSRLDEKANIYRMFPTRIEN